MTSLPVCDLCSTGVTFEFLHIKTGFKIFACAFGHEIFHAFLSCYFFIVSNLNSVIGSPETKIYS